jgi:GntP family gluconate:H+ symporter
MPWTMMLVALVVGIPVWFTVGLVLLVPILFTAARHTGLPLLRLGIPLLAGLSIAHGLVPPHPGPMAAIGMFKADTGKTIFYSLLIGFPTAIIAGPLFGHYISRFVSVPLGAVAASLTPSRPGKGLPGFGLTLFTILLPVLMILAATVADLTLAHQDALRSVLDFLGHPTVAMLVAVLFAYYSFGHARGFNRQELARFSESCLGPVATVLLVVGAGGGFNKVLVYSGVGDAIAALAKGLHLSPLLFGWLVAALIRVATGSATVAISTAAGIVAPLALSVPGTNLELLVIAMGAGSLILSHLNDGGFWFVKEYLGLDVTQTLKTWTVMETINAVLALIFTLLLDLLI